MNTQETLSITLIINPDDDSDYRDRLTRELLQNCHDWPGIADARLAGQGAPVAGARAGDIVSAGQLLMEVLPPFFQGVMEQVGRWLERGADTPRVKIQIGERVVDMPADTSPERLRAWCEALQSPPENPA